MCRERLERLLHAFRQWIASCCSFETQVTLQNEERSPRALPGSFPTENANIRDFHTTGIGPSPNTEGYIESNDRERNAPVSGRASPGSDHSAASMDEQWESTPAVAGHVVPLRTKSEVDKGSELSMLYECLS